MKRIGIIGFGYMGEALVKGILKANPDLEVGVIEKATAREELAVGSYGCKNYGDDFKSLFSDSELVILAIKPQQASQLLPKLKNGAGSTPVISVLAGTTTSAIASLLGKRPIVRFMPNLAAQVGSAVVGVCFSPDVEESLKEDALALAAASGTPVVLEESQMAAITGLSGSGIAYVFQFIHALALGGTKNGIPYAQSLETAIGVVQGAAAVLKESGVHPQEMVSRVCSPAGTTVEGVLALEEGGLTHTVVEAVTRAADRAQELET